MTQPIDIAVGDFVNFTDWFSDVWAEVLYATPGDKPIIRYCAYNKGGTERWVGWEMGRVRKVVKAVDAETSDELRHASVIYRAREYRGGFGRMAVWGKPLTAASRYDSNHRECITDADTKG